MKFKFLGVRGSTASSDKGRNKIGANTTCIDILSKDNKRIILDAGTGIIKLSETIIKNKEKEVNIFLSHTHWDHIQGFPLFLPIFFEDFTINIYGPYLKKFRLKDLFKIMMSYPFFPVELSEVKAKINFFEIKDNDELNINGFKIKSKMHIHPVICYSYSISNDNKKLTFSTDTEHFDKQLDDRVVEIAKNSDILIHDSQYFPHELKNRKGWGHSTFMEAIKVAKKSNSKFLYLFHHDPYRSDKDVYLMQSKAKKYFKNLKIASETKRYIKV